MQNLTKTIVLYDDYNINDDDIREYFEIDKNENISDNDYSFYLENMFDNLKDDLEYNFTKSNYYIARATRHTHYGDYYKNGVMGYKIIDDLSQITTFSQDYNIIEYLRDEKAIKMTTIGHDNNYEITIKAINKNGERFIKNDYDINNLSYKQFENIFNKYTKQIKEV